MARHVISVEPQIKEQHEGSRHQCEKYCSESDKLALAKTRCSYFNSVASMYFI
jgi:hypothetical protein